MTAFGFFCCLGMAQEEWIFVMSETGHIKNVEHFTTLISYVTESNSNLFRYSVCCTHNILYITHDAR